MNIRGYRKLLSLIGVLSIALFAIAACSSDDSGSDLPGDGVTVQSARATWNTGYFNEAIYSRGLEELGYTVKEYLELDNPLFYQSVGLGEVDFWANGWFPAHNQYAEQFRPGADIYGTVVKGGALQGYLIDKAGADEFGITSLADFERPEVAAAYDTDGDGKANLTACPPGWGCNTIISYHLDELNLRDFINEGTAGYSPAMADTLARYANGEHILFYTWTPNWTVSQLVPGEDVVWINIPGAVHPEGLTEAELTHSGILGAVTDPILMGFAASDIQVVANNEFIDDNPAAKKLFSEMQLTLGAVANQNNKMNEGEDSDADIQSHVDQWIAANQVTWDGWITAAKDAG
ncbi:MAG: glycine betaine/L-proline ABC transporter substrate-binding protein ProX [Chloroflexi bacterium]|nr:glycine betaine/L-proline ABC transporter substrate-binding protein ProX [Chloroflexota bacterium]